MPIALVNGSFWREADIRNKRSPQPPRKAVLRPAFLWFPLIAQRVSNRQKKVASELIRDLAAGIFDTMVTSVVAELPVIEFSVAVLDNIGVNL
jgi:hypothetical protein